MKRIAIYTRVSTKEQADSGLGLEAQKRNIEKYIDLFYPDAIKIYFEDGGVSGTNTKKRKMLNKMLDQVKEGYIDIVMIYKIDRLSRNLLDYVSIVEILEKYDAGLISICERFDTATAVGKAMSNILATFAEMESNLISQRTIDAAVSMLERGEFPFRSPFGYRKENKKLVLDEFKSVIVKYIFQRYTETQNIRIISDEIMKKYQYYCNQCMVGSILACKKYLGEYTYKNKEYKNLIPKIVDKNLFQEVAQLRKNKVYQIEELQYLFGNKVYCLDCKKQASKNRTRKNKKEYFYYCPRCTKKYINVSVIQRDALYPILKHLNNDVAALSALKCKDKLKYLKKRIKLIENKCKNGLIAKEESIIKIKKLKKELNITERKIVSILSNTEKINTIEKFYAIVQQHIKKIEVNFYDKEVDNIIFKNKKSA